MNIKFDKSQINEWCYHDVIQEPIKEKYKLQILVP